MLNKRLDDLIEAGWHVIDTDFDGDAFRHWRNQVSSCLSILTGPEDTSCLSAPAGPDEHIRPQIPECEYLD
jgi:hypothetical protein